MVQPTTITQKIKKSYESPLDVAMVYYQLISTVNHLDLTTREIQLLGFMATRGGVLTGGTRSEFVAKFNSSKATVYNLVSNLQEIRVLVKKAGKIMINPVLYKDFSNPLTLQLDLNAANRQAS